jgi:hypothetical protein
MNRIKRIVFVFLSLFIGIQLIQPARNKSGQVLPIDFTKVYEVPSQVQTILQNTCYDCHSSNTRYPWYSSTQPIAWIMASHIKNGKEQLNFSVFGSYSLRRQISKLKDIANQVKADAMPISSYKMMHRSANLTREDKALIENWMNKMADSISVNN